jgi:hypothetical protein
LVLIYLKRQFIFLFAQENEPKERARAPLLPARRRRSRRVSELASLKQADTLFPPPSPMLGAGQRGNNVNILKAKRPPEGGPGVENLAALGYIPSDFLTNPSPS